jgi:thiamine biosynthesis lipoprotein ApbE
MYKYNNVLLTKRYLPMLAVKKLTGSSTIFNRETRLMGNRFEISLVANDAIWAHTRIDSAIAEINRVDKLLSTFTEDSTINEINRNAGIKPVRVDAEIFRLVDRAVQISSLTDGTFDIPTLPQLLSAWMTVLILLLPLSLKHLKRSLT